MIFSFMDIAEQYVETNLNFDAVKDYVPYILEFDIDNLKTATLPGISERAGNGVWIYSIYEEEAKATINELFFGITQSEDIDGNIIDGNTTLDDNITNTLSIEILNGSGSSSKLSEVVSELEATGFEVIQIGNTSTTNNTTVIERNDMSESERMKIKDIIGTENIISGDSNSIVDITIIIGTDYVM